MKNVGKIFESQVKKSMPEYVLLCRLPDSAQAFGGCSSLRFSRKPPFDYIAYDSKRRILYAIELKSVQGKSISFERDKEQNGEIHYHQIAGLTDWGKFPWVVAGFLIEFREIETTVFLTIDAFNELTQKVDKKSFRFSDLEEQEIPYLIVPQKKKVKWFTYDMESLFTNFEKILISENNDTTCSKKGDGSKHG